MSCVGVGDGDRFPGDGGVLFQMLLLPKVVRQGGGVLLADVCKGGIVIVETDLEGDSSFSNIFL